MKKMTWCVLAVLLASILITGSTAFAAKGDKEFGRIKLTSGPLGSGWYPFSVSLSEIWMDKMDILISIVEGSGLGNIKRINNKNMSMPIGMAYTTNFMAAFDGAPPFKKKYENLRLVAALYPTWTTIAVREDSGISRLEDIFDKRIAPGGPTFSSTDDFRRILNFYGKDFDDIKKAGGQVSYGSYSDSANLIRDGIADVMVAHGAPEVVALSEIDRNHHIKLLEVPDEVLDSLKGFAYRKEPIPANTYSKQDKPVPTMMFYTCLAAHKNVPEELIYQLTKNMWDEDNLKRLRKEQNRAKGMKLETATGGFEDIDVARIHPGALRFYKEKGIIK